MKDRKDKYWICRTCAHKKNWKSPNHSVTIVRGLCGHCKREDATYLVPVVDFETKTRKPIFD